MTLTFQLIQVYKVPKAPAAAPAPDPVAELKAQLDRATAMQNQGPGSGQTMLEQQLQRTLTLIHEVEGVVGVRRA